MIVVRFKVRCQPEKAEQALSIFREVVAASQGVPGVLKFDMAIDLMDPNTFIATEVFADLAGMQAQERLPSTQRAIALLGDMIAAPPDTDVFETPSRRDWAPVS